jgi:hypothetical protein
MTGGIFRCSRSGAPRLGSCLHDVPGGLLDSGTCGPSSRGRHHQNTCTSDSQKLGMHIHLPLFSEQQGAAHSTTERTCFRQRSMTVPKFSCGRRGNHSVHPPEPLRASPSRARPAVTRTEAPAIARGFSNLLWTRPTACCWIVEYPETPGIRKQLLHGARCPRRPSRSSPSQSRTSRNARTASRGTPRGRCATVRGCFARGNGRSC